MAWVPATIKDVEKIVADDLANCTTEQRARFKQRAITPYFAPIVRYGKREQVVIVARKNNEVIYWEDVEEGFNLSPIATDGTILEHFCNQDSLGIALNAWITC